MATRPREWPNRAKEARDRAAEECARAYRALQPLLTEGARYTEVERLRRIAVALDALQTALRFLESVGAQTRPY